MATALPQQVLLLELLIMSGDIAVSDNEKYEILHRTLNECIDKGWVKANRFGAGFNKVSVTEAGRAKAIS